MRRLAVYLFALSFAAVRTSAEDVHFQCAQTAIGGSEAGPISLEVLRDGDLNLQATARCSVQEQLNPLTPLAWTQIAFYSLPFPAGSNHTSASVQVNDGYYIGDRTLRASCDGFVGPSDRYSTHFCDINIFVFEDEPIPTIAVSDASVIEGDSLAIPFTLSAPFGRLTNMYVYGYSSGTASGNDYAVYKSIPMDVGITGGVVPIIIADDHIDEGNETFEVRFSAIDRLLKTITVTIIDDDHSPYPLSLDQSSYEFHEGGVNPVTVTRGGNTSVGATASLHVNTLWPGQWPADVPVVFVPGQTSKTVQLSFDDNSFTNHRFATLELRAENRFLGARAVVAMVDDDPMPVLSIAGGEVVEGATGEKKQIDVTVTLSAPVADELRFDVVTAAGSAGPDDFTPLAKSFSFLPGITSRKVPIEVRGDDDREADETFTVALAHCCNGYATVGGPATVTILNDDGGSASSYQFERPLSAAWNESQKWLVATVVRGGDITIPSTAQVKLAAGPARQFAPLDVHFRANETRKAISFFIDDSFYSGNASGTLEIFADSRRDDRQDVTIAEDEARPVVTVSDVEITEGANDLPAAFAVSVTPPSFLPIEMRVMLSEESAAGDFSNLFDRQRLTIPSLSTATTIPFTIVGDSIPEEDASFSVGASLMDPADVLFGHRGRCLIHDDDTPGARLQAPAAIERGMTATFTLSLAVPARAAETIRVSTPTPELLTVPEQIAIPAGAWEIPFPVVALRTGTGVVSVTLPERLGSAVVSAASFIHSVSMPIVPELVRLQRGSTASVNVRLATPPDGEVRIAVSSSDRSIAAADAWALLAPAGTFQVYGASTGKTTLTITLPAELGGTMVVVPVEVIDPVEGRTRASRH